MSAAGADNTKANSNNIIFTMKEIKLYIPVVTLSANDNYQTFLAKDFKDQLIGMNIKQNVTNYK